MGAKLVPTGPHITEITSIGKGIMVFGMDHTVLMSVDSRGGATCVRTAS